MNDDEIKIESDENLDDSVVAEENMSETIKKLREKLKSCENEKNEFLTGWQRAKADLINARKRDEDDRKQFVRFANENLIGDLIPVLESYDMARSHKESWEMADKNWRTGIEQIFSQLKKTLLDNGLKELDPIGEIFDTNRDEATSYEQITDSSRDHKIIRVVQKGYSLNDKIIKAPKVVVGQYEKP